MLMRYVLIKDAGTPQAKYPGLFQFDLVAQESPLQGAGDSCKDTCKITCKLECHSGAPFMDTDEPFIEQEVLSTTLVSKTFPAQ